MELEAESVGRKREQNGQELGGVCERGTGDGHGSRQGVSRDVVDGLVIKKLSSSQRQPGREKSGKPGTEAQTWNDEWGFRRVVPHVAPELLSPGRHSRERTSEREPGGKQAEREDGKRRLV